MSPVRSAEGRIVGASNVARDLSETKRALGVDLHLSAIVNSSDDAIISKNLDGVIQTWNAAAERIFGYTAAEIIGRPVMLLIPEGRNDEEPRILSRLRRGERVDHFETVRVRKNGEHFPVSLTISPIKNAEGTIIGASKIARDITELKLIAADKESLLESERKARAQAEQANRMKDEFLAVVSHELRTPLNAIVGWTDVLREGGRPARRSSEGIEVIKRNAFVQAQLIDDLLDLGRITSGKMVIDVRLVDLGTVARAAIASIQHAADAKRIVIKATTIDFAPRLNGDPRRIQQAIWNLLANAVKFTDSGGLITLWATQVCSGVELSISDNGIGIAPQFMPHLFERFRQADPSNTRQHGGLGIGLALVKQLVELHGGSVRAESGGIGRGSRFTIRLPIAKVTLPADAAPVGSRPEDGEPAGLAGIKVLTVDDDRDSADVVKRILTSRGAEVRTANSVAGAWEVLRTFSPSVVLSDIGMPTHDGYEFVRQMREKPFFSGIPAVALTALARAEDRTRALNAGFQTHIAKPIAAPELIAVVRSLGRLHAARDAEPT